MDVSQSKIKVWRTCKQQYHYRYVEKLRKKKIRRPFQFGKILHSMIEALAEGDDPFEVLDAIEVDQGNMFRAEVETYGEIIEDSRVIMQEYLDYWKKDTFQYVRIKGKSSEHKFEVEILPGVTAMGFIDGIVRRQKLRYLLENKTFTKIPSDDDRWRNLQSCVYVRINDMLGWKPLDGVAWDYIRSKPPLKPELLKSGEMSKKKIDTFPSTYLAALKENKLKVADYKDMLDTLREERSRAFIRHYTPVSRHTVDEVFNDFVESAREISELHGKSQVRNMGFHCRFCDYEPICRATLQDLDPDFVKEREYMINEKTPEEPTVPTEE